MPSSYFDDVLNTLRDISAERVRRLYLNLDWPRVFEVIGIKPALKPKGYYVNLCVFHQEKTPSLYFYSPPRQFRFKCYGCGLDGDIVMFIIMALRINSIEDLEEVFSRFSGYRCESEEQKELPFDG